MSFEYIIDQETNSKEPLRVALIKDAENGEIDLVIKNHLLSGEDLYIASLTEEGRLTIYPGSNFAGLVDEEGCEGDHIEVEYL
jgi:hypothetical protein